MAKFDQREADRQAELELTKFLDKYFYNKLINSSSNFKFIRANEISDQLKGIDIILDEGEAKSYFDEKAALHYINKNLSTFSFEINFINRAGKIHDVWWFNNKRYHQTLNYLTPVQYRLENVI